MFDCEYVRLLTYVGFNVRMLRLDKIDSQFIIKPSKLKREGGQSFFIIHLY